MEKSPPQLAILLTEKGRDGSWQGRRRPIKGFKTLALVKSVKAKVTTESATIGTKNLRQFL